MGKRKNRLTEKRLKDRRFRVAEERIIKTFFRAEAGTDTRTLAQEAEVARSTFYRHHLAAWRIVPDYEEYILRRYGRVVRKICRGERKTTKQAYFETLFFMVRQKEMFQVVLKSGNKSVMAKMVEKLKPKLTGALRLNEHSEKMFGVYISEVVEILWRWGERGFLEEEIAKVLGDVMYLTETAPKRLGIFREKAKE